MQARLHELVTDKIDDAQRRRGWRTFGLASAVCVACCAGPVLVAVGGIGAAGSVVASLLWPAAGAAIAAMTVAAVLALARRSR